MPKDSNAPPAPPPRPAPVRPPERSAAGYAAVIAAACLACTPLLKASEGERLRPYYDPAHILTWCDGETKGNPKDLYTSAECSALLQNRLARAYAPPIAVCLPELVDQRRVKMFAAFLDAAYNAGPQAVCQSRMARSVAARDLRGACNGFFGWRATALDRRTGRRIRLRGLEIRRANEAQLCMKGVG